jgi:diguanylate cyclase (GGDEF)-like protein/PAS domain S-box-containing protein
MFSADPKQSSLATTLPPPWRIFQAALLLGCLSFASRVLNQSSWSVGGVTILWPTNGLLLGVLLCSRRRHWPAYLAIAGFIDLGINLSLNAPFWLAAYLSACNLLEATLGGLLLYGAISGKPDLTQRGQLVAFLGYGVFLSPLVASFAASFLQNGYFMLPTLHNLHRWFTADALGTATVTPLYLAFRQKDRFSNRSWREIGGLFLLLGAVTFGVFWQTRFPLLFVVLPFLLFLGLRLGLAGSALGLLLVSIVGGILTTLGRGPTGLIDTESTAERDFVFQLFIAVAMLLLYIVEVRMAESKRLQLHLEGSERRFRLLAEASNDIIFRCDLQGSWLYVSPAIYSMLGWKPEEIKEANFQGLVHPDDKEALGQMMGVVREAGDTAHRPEFRLRKADGSYVWFEFNLTLFLDDDNGEPAGFVNVARDISRRKLEEADLQHTLATVEHLASSDALTGIANRRQFDLVIQREWLRAARERTSLSVLLMDVDRFKAYNDLYGHLAGDECLRRVAAAVTPLINRPADLLARYGGEEFVVVLPNTDSAGARQIAERIRGAIEDLGIAHPGNPPQQVITLSVGYASLIPQPESLYLHLLEAADHALYQAKSAGRNRVQGAEGFRGADPVRLVG